VHESTFQRAHRAFFFLFLEKEKGLCGGTEAKKKKSAHAGDYAAWQKLAKG
jgi:hypothetical protein